MTKKLGNTVKGSAREFLFVLCGTCGTNHNVAYDPNADEYICSTCIANEQDVIDSQDEEISEQEVLSDYAQDSMKMEEEYRIKGDI